MVLDIPSRLTELGGDFIKSIALYKKEEQCLALVFREGCKNLLKAAVSKSVVDGSINLTGTGAQVWKFIRHFFGIESCIEVAGGQRPAKGNSAAVRHLQNPKLCRSFGAVECLTQPIN